MRCLRDGCKDGRRRISRRVRSVYGRMISHRASGLTNDAEKAIAVKASVMHRVGLCRDDDAGNFAVRTQDKRRASLPVLAALNGKSILHERRNKSATTAATETRVSPKPFILD